MEWDLGFTGVGVLIAMSLGFGLLAQLLTGRGTTRWMWLIGASAFFVFGLLISEAWFGWATENDLQPNYDGLSFDETLLAIVPSVAVVIAARRIIRRHNRDALSDSRTSPPAAHPTPLRRG
jgi:hypothetical protein